MKSIDRIRQTWPARLPQPRFLLAAAGAFLASIQIQVSGTEFTQPIPVPGGVTPFPIVTSVSDVPGKDSVLLQWIGLQGPFQVQRKSSISGGDWTDVGVAGDATSATIPKSGDVGFHRVKGGAPSYLGAGECVQCHSDTYNQWYSSRHGNAYDTLKKIGQQNNPACVVCHTVGAGASTGFISEAATPHFANVQCENCHGPAGNHVGSGDPPEIFPITTKSPMLCGGCHNGFHHPTYDEWSSSPHSAVVEELAEEFTVPDRAAAVARMNSCGACHSGAVRLAMLSAYNTGKGDQRTNVIWPTATQVTNTAVACVVCHDPHGNHVYTNPLNGQTYTNQLRFPVASTNVFSYNTGTNFAAQFNPNVSVCGQCHNARGATVGSSGRPPHYSPQYNVYLGVIGVTGTTPAPQGAHKNNPLQCAGCHTHGHGSETATPSSPTYTGHAFRATIQACSVCHTNSTGLLSATNLLFTTQSQVSAMIVDTKNLLDLWASTKNTNAWASKYEKRGWEYTSPGELSNPSGSTTIVGPIAAEQAQIPQGIKDARFNLYLVNRDKSRGIHNAPYIRHLLTTAQDRVKAELAK